MWTIFKVFIEFVTVLLLFCVLTFWLQGMWDLNSPTRDQTCTPPALKDQVLTIRLPEVFLNYKHVEVKLFSLCIHYPFPQSTWGYEAFSILVVSLSICENRLEVSNFILLVRYHPRNIYNLRTLYFFFHPVVPADVCWFTDDWIHKFINNHFAIHKNLCYSK